MKDRERLVVWVRELSERPLGWLGELRRKRLEARHWRERKQKKRASGGKGGRKTKKEVEAERFLKAIADFRKGQAGDV